MKLTIILFFIVLFILLIPIKIRSKIIYDIYKNKGYLSLYFYKLKLAVLTLSFEPMKIVIDNKKHKSYFYLIKEKNVKTSFGDVYIEQLIKKIKINDFRTYARFGLMEDCMYSCLGTACIITFSSILNYFLFDKEGVFRTSINAYPDYLHNRFLLGYTASISLNIILLLYCVVLTLIKRRKEKWK